jgi:fermentation-respiration switch protein FrsA (DUF1100 family)
VVLYCHGNAGNLSHRAESVRRWQKLLGLAVLIFDYPGYGRSTGKPTEAGAYAAGEVMYRHLVQDRGIAPERIVLQGGSLGAAVAIELARKHPHRALVLVGPFTSLADMASLVFPWLPPIRWAVGNHFDNLAKIGECKGPVFIAHGTKDTIIPFEQGRRLYQTARQPARFFPMEGYDHNNTPGPDFYAALREFLRTKGDDQGQ